MKPIRQASPNDTHAIANILESVWPDEQADLARLAAVLKMPTHVTLVWLANQQIVGFIDAFETQAANGSRRWELDLLAVNPAHQGQGIGRQLIAAAKEVGIQRDIPFTRALIASHNIASQRAFARCGYQSDGKAHELYVSSKRSHYAHLMPTQSTLIPVSTLRYQGAWLEERWTTQALTAAQHLREQNKWDIVGAVIPLAQPQSIQAAKEAAFEPIGRYSWWKYDA